MPFFHSPVFVQRSLAKTEKTVYNIYGACIGEVKRMDKIMEAKLAAIRNFRPIDDVFFEVLARNPAVCQEILRTILEDPGLIVEESIVQSSQRNLYGRSVRLDALCTLGSGKKVNIEVQRSDDDNHFKRVRFNESVLTAKESNPGDKFENILDLIVVYISEFDFIKGGKTIYHAEKILRETGEVIDDGVKEVYVNTAVDDGTDIANLMSCFTKKSVDNPKFPVFSKEIKNLKDTEGGQTSMCAILKEFEDIVRKESKAEGKQEILNALLDAGSITPEVAAQFMPDNTSQTAADE